jgi:putative methyltransferase (TIGR04325 family)
MSVRSLAKAWIPPIVTDARRAWLGHGLRFSDVRGDWRDAVARSHGYAADLIVEAVARATREVLAGRAVFERDSVLFDQPDFRYPILAALLRAAVQGNGLLEVVDFGGSLGSTYRQCRPFLAPLRNVRWHVIEQPGFVDAGRREFTTEELDFSASVAELPAFETPAVILLSSVIQYVEDPDRTRDELIGLNARHLVIDRTPLSDLTENRLCIQHVPKTIYDASYPCWILSRSKLLSRLDETGWQVLGEFPGLEGSFATPDRVSFEFRGLIAARK